MAFLKDHWVLIAALGGALWWFSSVARKDDVQKQIDKAIAPIAQQIKSGFEKIDKVNEKRQRRFERWVDGRFNRLDQRVRQLERSGK